MEITFIRHGPPEFDSSRWLHQCSLKQLLGEYDAARVVSPSPADLLTKIVVYSDDQVFCSTLPRCLDSAMVLGFANVIQIAELNEAELPCPSWPSIPAPYRVAIAVLRIMWFMGYSKGSESYRSTLIRASDASVKLIDSANLHGRVLVVGHGIMIRLICRKLKETGWIVDSSDQSGFWSTTRVTKRLTDGAQNRSANELTS